MPGPFCHESYTGVYEHVESQRGSGGNRTKYEGYSGVEGKRVLFPVRNGEGVFGFEQWETSSTAVSGRVK